MASTTVWVATLCSWATSAMVLPERSSATNAFWSTWSVSATTFTAPRAEVTAQRQAFQPEVAVHLVGGELGEALLVDLGGLGPG